MFKRIFLFCLLIIIMAAITAFFVSTNKTSKMKEANITYSGEGNTFKGFIAYDENLKGRLPIVLIVHEWWGLTDYPKRRARQIAELGYLAMAVDVFGNGRIASNPNEAQELTQPFYKDPQLARQRLTYAINKIKTMPQADTNQIVAIGYCFGGYVVINAAKLGSDLDGVVIFHGGLGGAPVNKDLLKARILVCAGGSDKFVTQKDVNSFKHQMDSINADYEVKVYPDATHAFTNPDATRIGKQFNMPIEYNPEADRNSWKDMHIFLKEIFNK